jgi:hypothetical protein
LFFNLFATNQGIPMKTTTLRLTTLAAAASLYACGGGGGGGADAPSPTPVTYCAPAKTTFDVCKFDVQGAANGSSITVTQRTGPLPIESYDGTLTATCNGTTWTYSAQACTMVYRPGNLLTTVQPHPYAKGSVEQIAFDEINRLRINGGFGAMIYSEALMQSSKNHVKYEILNNVGAGHTEDPALPGFTGVDGVARVKFAAQGTPEAGQIGGSEGGWSRGGALGSVNPVSDYSVATGHLQHVLSYASKYQGYYFEEAQILNNPSFSGPYGIGSLGFGGRMDNLASLASDKTYSIVGVYPFPGMTGVGLGLGTSLSLAPQPAMQGMNIMIQFPYNSNADLNPASLVNPVIKTFTLRKDGASADTPSLVHEAGTMHGTEPTIAGWAILFPLVTLDANSKYTVTFEGTWLGHPASKVWSFTTGASTLSRVGG